MENSMGCFKPVSNYLNQEEVPTTPNKTSDKNLVLSVSLLLRLMEFAKEDAKDDVALHQALENIMAFSDGHNALTIADYDNIIADAIGSSISDGEEVEPEENREYYDISDFEDVEIDQNAPVNGENCCVEPNYDLTDEEGNGKVNGQLVDELENVVDSYHEGGISGNDCYNSIQRAFDRNEQCSCCGENSAMSQLQSLLAGVQQPVQAVDYEINTDDGSIGSCPMCGEEELDSDTESKIAEIINLSRM